MNGNAALRYRTATSTAKRPGKEMRVTPALMPTLDYGDGPIDYNESN